ncbi:MAG: helix-turn-helix transcriptional regulator [Ruminococcus sp.]|nr:helix-turn-helix transcriptional regulator [Ruminococcus sp.]
MLEEKIEYLLRLLGTDNTTLAGYSGCSESNFSRLRSGARTPGQNSSTVRRFAEAVCLCAEDKKITDTLCSVMGCRPGNREHIRDSVISWLYREEGTPLSLSDVTPDPVTFGEKLDRVMLMAGLTNSRLSRCTNVDPSYISRMRSGQRMPRSNPSLTEKMCTVITSRIIELGKTDQLAALMGCPEHTLSEDDLPSMLASWLFDRSATAEVIAVSRLINTIGTTDTEPSAEAARREPVTVPDTGRVSDGDACYIGIPGIRAAAVRFLSTAARERSKRLLLYSDQSFDWMQGEFLEKWLTLMHDCLRAGTRIRIIHNIHRPPAEMISAISCWMPLYTSGLIESFYCTQRPGERFAVTLFSDPGRACVESLAVRGSGADAVYRYVTSPQLLALRETELGHLFAASRPLVKLERRLTEPEGCFDVIERRNVRVCIGSRSVVVNKLSAPQLSFVFEHPMMIGAFRAYAGAGKAVT